MIIQLDSLSYSSIDNNLVNYIMSQEETLVWKDFLEGSTGTQILELLSAWGAYLSYMATVNRREDYLQDAQNYTSLVAIAQNLGYSVPRGKNEGKVITIKASATKIIPANTVVGTCKDVELITANEVNLNIGEDIDITVYIGNMKSEEIIVNTNKLAVFRFTSQNVSDYITLLLNDVTVPLSNVMVDLAESQNYVALTNPFGAVDVMFLNKSSVNQYNYKQGDSLVLNYIELTKIDFTLEDMSFDYGEILSSTDSYAYIPPEEKDSIRVNAPLYHEVQTKIRGRSDYLKAFRYLAYNFADTNESDFSPSIVNLTYMRNDYTLLTQSEEIAIRSAMAKQTAMGIEPPIITNPVYEQLRLKVDIKLEKKQTVFANVDNDVANIINILLAKQLSPVVDLDTIEHNIERLDYVKTADVGYIKSTWQHDTKYRLGDFVTPSIDDGFLYKLSDYISLSGVSEPTWTYGIGDVKTDAELSWKCVYKYGYPQAWKTRKNYQIGDVVIPTIINKNNAGMMFECVSISKLSGVTQPAWSQRVGSFTEDGDVIWICKILNTTDNVWEAGTAYNKGNSIKQDSFSYECVGYKGTSGTSEPIWRNSQKYLIIGVDIPNKTFKVSGDQSSKYLADDVVKVKDSTGNDGQYTVALSTYTLSSDTTKIQVLEGISNSTASGYLYLDDTYTRDSELLWEVFSPLDTISYKWNEYLDVQLPSIKTE